MKLNPSQTAIFKRLLANRSSRPLRAILSRIDPADASVLVSQLDRRDHPTVWEALIALGVAHQVLLHLPDMKSAEFFGQFNESQQVTILERASEDQAALLLATMPAQDRTRLLDQLDPPVQRRIQQVLSYPRDSAGRLMSPQVFRLSSKLSVEQALSEIRAKAQELSIYYLYCVDEEDRLEGVVSLRQLATSHPTRLLRALMKTQLVTVPPEAPARDVALLVSRYDFVAIPVVDPQRKILGLIAIDDVLDIIQEQANASLYAQAGLQEGDRVYSSVAFKLKHRLPWVFLNLLLAAIASSVASAFEQEMHELILLASVKNIVAGLGGNTAIQTLTVVTRGLATGDFSFTSRFTAITRELLVGLLLGLVSGLACGLMIYAWKGDHFVAVVICLAMFLNSLVGALFGALVPLAMARFRRDPAIGSGVIITMVTDIFGFFSFLGLASLGLKYLG